jgi:hypothetical protein
MKSRIIRRIGLFATVAFTLRQFRRVSSVAIGGIPRPVARMDAILCGMTIALMSSWLLSAIWRIFAMKLSRTRIEEQIVTFSDIVMETWENVDFGFDENAACDPLVLSSKVGRGVKSREAYDVVGIYQVEACERAA